MTRGAISPSTNPAPLPHSPRPIRGRRSSTALSRIFRLVPARRLPSGTLVTAKLDLGLQGAAGAVHLEVALNWYVDEHPAHARLEHPPQGTGLYLHRRTAVGQSFPLPAGRCEWLGFEPCFPESLSFVLAGDLALDLRDRGDEAVWQLLEQLYREKARMRRRALLTLAPAAALASLLAPLARGGGPADPILRAVLETGGRIRYWPRDSTQHYVAWVVNRSGDVVGYIARTGKYDGVTKTWPPKQ